MHQLDFHVTIWSDDKETMLRLEQWLKELYMEPEEHRLAIFTARLEFFDDTVTNLDVHSVDINWDDDEGDEDGQVEVTETDGVRTDG